ncbi:hypothetical protein Y032_0223g2656 [Ancylostoma ceylanicum]|uniref:Uncharacterized protein n=1 Tax=Ancylostoma ceylanicum TaxID=53326 RepID=A0A016SI99_9BILA|nr:hypothetical protein Y032_0223g2656 [Ancylostoma ceylanicum]
MMATLKQILCKVHSSALIFFFTSLAVRLTPDFQTYIDARFARTVHTECKQSPEDLSGDSNIFSYSVNALLNPLKPASGGLSHLRRVLLLRLAMDMSM